MAITQVMRGMTKEVIPNGAMFVRLHYSADPEKNSDWKAIEEAKESDPRNWDVQMEMRDVVLDGYPVFARYMDSVHCPQSAWHHYLELTEGSHYFGGWDAGQTLSPAFLLKELTPDHHVRDLLEVVSTVGESMEEFAPRVRKEVDEIYPGLLDVVRHYGDATIEQRSGTDKSTARQVARKYGFEIEPITNDWTKRQSAVAFLLKLGLPEEPKYLVSGKGCPTLRRGFQGMYKFKLSSSSGSTTSGAGAVLVTPLKNAYSHVHDANQYASMPIFDMLKPGGGGWVTDQGFLDKLKNR